MIESLEESQTSRELSQEHISQLIHNDMLQNVKRTLATLRSIRGEYEQLQMRHEPLLREVLEESLMGIRPPVTQGVKHFDKSAKEAVFWLNEAIRKLSIREQELVVSEQKD